MVLAAEAIPRAASERREHVGDDDRTGKMDPAVYDIRCDEFGGNECCANNS